MKRFLCVVATAAAFLFTLAAWAEDQVFVRGKEKAVKGVIEKENAKGVVLKGGTTVPAESIEEILYDVEPIKVLVGIYRPAFLAEKDSLDPAKDKTRAAKLEEAVKNFQELTINKDIKQPLAKRHAEYKVGALLARQAAEDGKPVEPAIEALKKFKSKHPDSWQIGPCLQLLGRLQLEKGDYAGAQETFAELAQANVPDDIKQEAQLQGIQVSIRAGKAGEAQQALDGFMKSLPKDSKFAVKARVAQGELQLHAKNYDEALKILNQAGKETTDKALKALIYNAKGICLVERDPPDYKGARWEFLWVDVVYNQDPKEHAKALYYLSKVFEQLGDAEKAQECREQLLNDRAFAGSEWRAKAQKEAK